MTNYKQLYAKKKSATDRLLKIIPTLQNESGIYVFRRYENGFKYAYIGQAKHLVDRLVSHLLGYQQRIDISIKKRGFDVSKGGWQLLVYYFNETELDDKERYYIEVYANGGFQLYNKTLGGQDDKKSALGENGSTKGYRDGIVQGEINTKRMVQEYFEKYLDVEIKEPKLNKNGSQNATKLRKYSDFMAWLKN